MAKWTGKGSGFFTDFSAFGPTFKTIVSKTIPYNAKKAQFMAGNMALKDAIKEIPKVPRKIGNLQASGLVIPDPSPFSIQCIIGFNTDYAAKMHEAPETWSFTLPGSGPKYLIKTLTANRNKYIMFIAKNI